jgi:hypothetical protein
VWLRGPPPDAAGRGGTVVSRYAHTLAELGLLPVWVPSTSVAPGDVGRLEDSVFARLSSAFEHGLSLPPVETTSRQDIVSVGKGASVTWTSRECHVRFEDDVHPMIAFGGCREHRLDELDVAQELLRAWNDGRLRPGLDFVVTLVLESEASLIAVPAGPGAELVLELEPSEGPQPTRLEALGGATILQERGLSFSSSSRQPAAVGLVGLEIASRLLRRTREVTRHPGGVRVPVVSKPSPPSR